MGEGPEDEQGEPVDGGQDSGEAVGREVVTRMVRRRTARVPDQCRHVNVDEVQVMKVGAPCPHGYNKGEKEHSIVSTLSLAGNPSVQGD